VSVKQRANINGISKYRMYFVQKSIFPHILVE
jgi:hypothetical protein